MKTLLLIMLLFLPGLAMTQNITESEFKVYGACGMCKARIEKAAALDGVTAANWSQETQTLTLSYDANQVDLDEIHKSIAKAGHDTEKVRAQDVVYENLPACCQYERPDDDNSEQSDKSESSCCSSYTGIL